MGSRKIIVPIATALSMIAALGLAGCGGSTAAQTKKTADGRIEITMWHGYSEVDGKTLTGIVDEFNKSQKKWKIDAQLQPWNTIGETMVTKVTSGDGPDLVTIGNDSGEGWAYDGTFQCVTDFYDNPKYETKNYLKSVVSEVTYNIDGKEEKCAVPQAIAPVTVWYNTDMWKAAGLTDKDIPTTWDQLLDVARKLTKPDGSQYGFANPDQGTGWASLLRGNGTGLYVKNKATINTPENKAFLTKMREFYKDGYSLTGLDDTTAQESFASGQSAMYIAGPWVDAVASGKGINHDTFRVPDGTGTFKFPNGAKGLNSGQVANFWWVTSQVKDKNKKEGIYEFLKFYNNHDNQVKWSLGSAYTPNNTTVKASELSERPMIAKISQYTGDSFVPYADLKGGYSDITTTMSSVTTGVARTDDDIQGLLDTAQKKLQGYLDEYAIDNDD